MVFEQRYGWGRAYRDGRLVCWRVHVSALHAELAARRAAERMEPVVIVVDDPRRGRERVVGRLQPPQVRGGDLYDIEFVIRELPTA